MSITRHYAWEFTGTSATTLCFQFPLELSSRGELIQLEAVLWKWNRKNAVKEALTARRYRKLASRLRSRNA
jgi:hypothetical protein